MAFTKKTWVNVSDPDSYTGNIPLSDLPRLDADNMNRIETGVDDAHKLASDVRDSVSNVPNVATNDQTPTYAESGDLSALASGEKLNVAFGKIKKAIDEFISHKSNDKNPHGITPEQIGTLKIYNGLTYMNSKLGTNFDLLTPVNDIIKAMPAGTGVIADIADSYGVSEYPAPYGILSIYKMRDNRVSVEFMSSASQAMSDYNERWIGQHNSETFGGFCRVLTSDNKRSGSYNGTYVVNGYTGEKEIKVDGFSHALFIIEPVEQIWAICTPFASVVGESKNTTAVPKIDTTLTYSNGVLTIPEKHKINRSGSTYYWYCL